MGIGTEHESTLHRELKFRYAAGGETEVQKGAYVCDAVDAEGELIEIQTGSFAPLRQKLPALTAFGPVRLIHPVIVRKTIELFDTQGTLLYQRKSPRRGSIWSLFAELLYAPELALLPNLTIEAVLVEAVERRIDDGKGSWRRKGVSIVDRALKTWLESAEFSGPADFKRLLPFKAREEFSSSLLAERAGIRRDLAGKSLYVLRKIGAIRRLRKEGRSWIYRKK